MIQLKKQKTHTQRLDIATNTDTRIEVSPTVYLYNSAMSKTYHHLNVYLSSQGAPCPEAFHLVVDPVMWFWSWLTLRLNAYKLVFYAVKTATGCLPLHWPFSPAPPQ